MFIVGIDIAKKTHVACRHIQYAFKKVLQADFIFFRSEQEFKQIVICERKRLCVIHFSLREYIPSLYITEGKMALKISLIFNF